jgi:predicted  nucleic acid-binding Zn-ribbon protein
MPGIEQTERQVESQLEKVESTTERIERDIDECETRIRRLEADIQAARSKGDSSAAAAMQRSLTEQQAERQRLESEADQESQRLQSLQREIKGVDAWNTELQRIIAAQSAEGIDTSELESRAYDRQRWVEEQWERVQRLLQRIGQMRT